VGSVAALLAILLLAGLRLAGGLPRQSVRLPDGQVLRLEAVTYGARHEWAPWSPWQRLLQKVQPPSPASGPYRVEFADARYAESQLVLWFTRPNALPGSLPVMPRVVAADESGQEYALAGGASEARSGMPLVEYLMVSRPHRGRTVTLRFYDRSGSRCGSLTVANPADAPELGALHPDSMRMPQRLPPPPAAGARECPVSASSGSVSATLTEVTTGLVGGDRNRFRPEEFLSLMPPTVSPGQMPCTRVTLRLTRSAAEWDLQTLVLRDGDGVVAPKTFHASRNGTIWVAVPGWLGLDGGPVSARLLLQRRGSGAFPREHIWTVPAITVPAEGEETTLGLTRTIQGVRLDLQALAARGTSTGPGRRDLEKSPYLRLHAIGLKGPRLVSVWATDPRGRRFNADLKAYGVSDTGYNLRIRMPIARDAKRVTLHFVVHPPRETRTLDFMVQPRRAAGPAPSASTTGGLPQ